MAKTYITTKGQTISNPRGGTASPVPGGQGAPAVVAAPIGPAGAGGPPSRATIDDVLECLDIAGELLEQYEREGDDDDTPAPPNPHHQDGDEPRHTPSKTVQDVKEDAPPPAPSKGKNDQTPGDQNVQPQPTPPKRGFRHLAARGLFG